MNLAAQINSTVFVLLLGIILSYLAGKIFHTKERQASGIVALLALVVALITFSSAYPFLTDNKEEILLFGILKWDMSLLGWIISMTGLVLTTVVTLYSITYMEEDTGNSKFFPLLILLLLSVFGLSFTSDLFNIYLFFELLSAASFALIAFRKDQWDPVEAGIKFVAMSAVGSALILLGVALVYTEFGNLDLNALSGMIQESPGNSLFLPLICFTIGFGIKASVFPLHTWLPDAHAEAPSGISAMLSGIIIEIGFFILFRIFLSIGDGFPWGQLLIWIALLTMTAGNLMALSQKKLKRMLAYSSIAQMGYILLGISIGIAYGVQNGIVGGTFHIVTHAFMKGLAFLCAGAFIFRFHSGDLEEMRGAAWRMPVTAITFLIAVLALAGVPPMSGFMSKLWIYQSGIQSDTTLGWTASVIAIINSVLSLGYYLPAVWVLFSKTPTPKAMEVKEVPFLMSASLVILALITIFLGVIPNIVRDVIEQSLAMFC